MTEDAAKPKFEIVPDAAIEQQADQPAAAPGNIFLNLDKLRKDCIIKVRRKVLTTTVALGKPSPNVYFRCHPDLCLEGAWIIKGDRGSSDFYFIAPPMLNPVHPLLIKRLRRTTIALTYTWPSGEISVWPVPDPPKDTKVKSWKSAKAAYEQGKVGWVQLVWNEDKMDFDVTPPEGSLPEPLWPANLNLSEKLMLAFEGRVIDSDSHPYMLQLRGIVD
jgi:hypothetical protein